MDEEKWALYANTHGIDLVPDGTVPENELAIVASKHRIAGEEYDLVLSYNPDPLTTELVDFLERSDPSFKLTALYHLKMLQSFLQDENIGLETYIVARKIIRENRPFSLDAHQWLSTTSSIAGELEKYGIPIELSTTALDMDVGTAEACDSLCLRLLGQINQRHELEGQGTTHLARSPHAIPNSLVNEAAMRMLEVLSDVEETTPASLIILLRLQLNRTGTPAFVPKSGQERKELAVLLTASDPSLSARSIGKAVGVAHTTIRAWKRDPDFQERVRNSAKVDNVEILVKKLQK